MLNGLLTLADDKSSEKRFELLNAIADMFVDDTKSVSNNELELFSDVFIKLLGKMDEASKAEISIRFAQIPNIPKPFALVLVAESAEIAAPMLEHSRVFADDELIDITNASTTEHRVSIAKRPNVSSSITDALIEHCETPVFRSVAHNESSNISYNGFNNMLKHSPDDGNLLAMLLQRGDLPDEIKTLLPHMRGGIYDKVERVANTHNPSEMQDLLDRTHEVRDTEKKLAALKTLSTLNEVNQIRIDAMTLSEAVIKLASAANVDNVIQLLTEITQIEQAHFDFAMFRYNGDPITMLCRSIELTNDAFWEICCMREALLGLSPTLRTSMLKSFKKLDVKLAKRTIGHMRLKSQITAKQQ